MKTISNDTSRNNYGVLAASVINLESVKGLIVATDELQSPLIILIGQMQMIRHTRADMMAPPTKALAEETNVPVALIPDHGRDWEVITHAYRNGFSSIITDTPVYKVEENIRGAKKVIEMCHPQRVAAEAELGHVEQAALGDQTDDSCYIRSEDVTEFSNQICADCLTIACGTAHGQYLKGVVPEVHFDIIGAVKKVTDVPIALHGSSGSGDENIKKAVEVGINKTNTYTKIFDYIRDKIRKTLEQTLEIDLLSLMPRIEQVTKEIGKHFIYLTGSQGKAADFQRKPAFQYGLTQIETDGGEQGEELTKAAPKRKRKYRSEGR